MGVAGLRRLTGIGLGIALLGVALVPTAALAGVSCDIGDTHTISLGLPCQADPPTVRIQVDEQGGRKAAADASASGRVWHDHCQAWGNAEATAGPIGIDLGGHYTATVQVHDEPTYQDEAYYPFDAAVSDSDSDSHLEDGKTFKAKGTGFAENLISNRSITAPASASYRCNAS